MPFIVALSPFDGLTVKVNIFAVIQDLSTRGTPPNERANVTVSGRILEYRAHVIHGTDIVNIGTVIDK